MPFPPRPECVPESPYRQLPGRSFGTPRVGKDVQYQNDEEDDVSVLTFHTMGTKDNTFTNHVGGSSSFVKSARESLERLILESKNPREDEDDGKSLSRISEEGGSQMSSCNSKKGYDRSPSSKASQIKIEGENKIDDHQDEEEADDDNGDDDYGDDDTISLAESILDSANKVLSSIGSSPYYGRGKKTSPPTDETPLPQPSPKHQSLARQPENVVNTEDDDKENGPKNIYSTKTESPIPKKKTANEHHLNLKAQPTPEVASNFLHSYFHDENTSPTADTFDSKSTYGPRKSYTKDGNGYDSSMNIHSIKKEFSSKINMVNDKDIQTKVSSDFLTSYFRDDKSAKNHSNENQDERIKMKESAEMSDTEEDDKENDSDHQARARNDVNPSNKIFNNKDNQLEVSSNFLSLYFRDEPEHHLKYSKSIRVQKLESERQHLQSLLKECQFETRMASQSLGASIKKANELLERISAGRAK